MAQRLKKCRTCKAIKSIEEFHKLTSSKDGLAYICKICANEIQKIYRLDGRVKRSHIKRRYNLSEEQYTELIKNGCNVCGTKKDLHVDHDHSCCPDIKSGSLCGKCIRGCLCGNHNRGMGLFKDDVKMLSNAIDYLNRWRQ